MNSSRATFFARCGSLVSAQAILRAMEARACASFFSWPCGSYRSYPVKHSGVVVSDAVCLLVVHNEDRPAVFFVFLDMPDAVEIDRVVVHLLAWRAQLDLEEPDRPLLDEHFIQAVQKLRPGLTDHSFAESVGSASSSNAASQLVPPKLRQ
jgi:hypothetical protein